MSICGDGLPPAKASILKIRLYRRNYYSRSAVTDEVERFTTLETTGLLKAAFALLGGHPRLQDIALRCLAETTVRRMVVLL